MKHYLVKEGKLVRTNPFCILCGRGVFMADHGDFWVCGKCGIRINKKFFRKGRKQ